MLSNMVEHDGNCIVGSVKGLLIYVSVTPLVEWMFLISTTFSTISTNFILFLYYDSSSVLNYSSALSIILLFSFGSLVFLICLLV